MELRPKRKVLEKLVSPPRKRRQPFNTAKDRRTKAIIQQNATNSPLLRLPREIRDRIWAFALGDASTLHLEEIPRIGDKKCRYSDRGVIYTTNTSDKERNVPTWRSTFCVACRTERDVYEDFRRDQLERIRKQSTAGPISQEHSQDDSNGVQYLALHQHCKNHLEADGLKVLGSAYASYRATPKLQILRVCRQFYLEAWPIFWTRTTFSFSDHHSFMKFMEERTSLQKRSIHSLSLSCSTLDVKSWNSILTGGLVSSLRNLRTLNLLFSNQREFFAPDFTSIRRSQTSSIDKCRELGFLNFRVLPLETANVIVCNATEGIRWSAPWTSAQCLDISDFVRDFLLDPRGAEAHEREMAEFKAAQQKAQEV